MTLKFTFKCIALAFIILTLPLQAHANLGVTPTLIVFEDGDRFADVTLINSSDETQTYAINWRFFKMNETGASYTPIDKSQTEFDVSEFVFFTPRRVTIPPKKPQKVRLALRRPKDVPAGDYHAHLQFSPIKEQRAVLDESGVEAPQQAAAGVSINVGYSIPVLVRAGQVEEKIEIEPIALRRNDQNILLVDVPIRRLNETYGALGHLYVYHQPAEGGEEKLIGEVSNANVFPEVEGRVIEVRLNENITGGRLRVVMKSSQDDSIILDDEIFPLN